MSSSRFTNSGLKAWRTSSLTASVSCSQSRVWSTRNWLPRLLVRIRMVFRKSTVRPWPSVSRPSSSTCSSTSNTSGCAFSTSSSRITEYGRRRTASVSWPPCSYPTYPGGAPTRRETENFSPYSLMSMRTRAFSSSNRYSASALASSVLPTPVGPEEQERAGRPVGVGDAGPGAAHGLADRANRRLLPDEPLAELALEMQQLLGLALVEPRDRDARPRGDDGGDVLVGHLVVDHARALLLDGLRRGELLLDARDGLVVELRRVLVALLAHGAVEVDAGVVQLAASGRRRECSDGLLGLPARLQLVELASLRSCMSCAQLLEAHLRCLRPSPS